MPPATVLSRRFCACLYLQPTAQDAALRACHHDWPVPTADCMALPGRRASLFAASEEDDDEMMMKTKKKMDDCYHDGGCHDYDDDDDHHPENEDGHEEEYYDGDAADDGDGDDDDDARFSVLMLLSVPLLLLGVKTFGFQFLVGFRLWLMRDCRELHDVLMTRVYVFMMALCRLVKGHMRVSRVVYGLDRGL